MGGGVSSISHTSEAFTNLEVELQKPSDGSDIKTPRGVTAQDEVVRLRKLLADLAVEGELLQRTEHQKRIKNSKNKSISFKNCYLSIRKGLCEQTTV